MIDFSHAAIQGFWLGEECVCRIAQVASSPRMKIRASESITDLMTITEEDKVVKSDY